jgi:hypothetical protein
VSRLAYDDVIRERQRYEQMYDGVLVEYQGLVDRMHQMVRDGWHVPVAPEAPPQTEAPLGDAVYAAINARSLDRDMGRDLESFARLQVSMGRTEKDIVQAIWDGEA